MKNLFNFNLYKESLKQQRVIGLIGTVITLISAFILPIKYYLDAIEADKYIDAADKSTVNILNSGYNYLLYPCFFAPLLILFTFSFLNNRNSSDFYHSVPHKRQTIFFSFFAASVTWLLVSVILTTFTSSLLYIIFSNYLLVNITNLILFAINVFFSSLMVMAITAFAISITGTLLTNVTVSLMIIFIPRIMIISIVNNISSNLGNISGSLIPLLDMKYNSIFLLLNSYLGIFSSDNSINLIRLSPTLIYSILSSLFFIVAGCYVFTKRKSEVAENSALNEKIQGIIRLTLGTLICLPSIFALFRIIINKHYFYDMDSTTIFYIVLFYIFSIIVLFIYELISTRKIQKAIGSFKSIPILGGINILLIIFMVLIFNFYLNYVPKSENVNSVNIGLEYFETDYFSSKIAEIDFTDKEIIELLTNANAYNVQQYKNYLNGDDYILYGKSIYKELTDYDIHAGSYSISDILYPNEETNRITVNFNSGIINTERTIILDYEDYEKLISLISTNNKYIDIYTNVPDIDTNTSVHTSASELSDTETKELYNIFKNELKTLSLDSLSDISLNCDSSILTFYINTEVNDTYYTIHYGVTKDMTKTLDAYLKILNKKSIKDMPFFESRLYQFMDSDIILNVYYYKYNDDLTLIENYYDCVDKTILKNNPDYLDDLLNNISPISNDSSLDDYFVNIILDVYNEDGSSYNFYYTFALSKRILLNN